MTCPALAFLDSTRDFDTVTLARRTQKALEIILPWCQVNNSSLAITQEIKKQALLYARAIDFSVEAAYDGFTIAEEVITLVGLIPGTTTKDRQDFLEGMQEFAQQGQRKAMQARNAFMNVRLKVEDLLARARSEEKEVITIEMGNSTIQRRVHELSLDLSRGVHDLEDFGDILSNFVAWWNEIKMETDTQLRRQEMVANDFERLRLRSIELKWKDHRSRYAAYCNEIGIVQDRYPEVFTPSKRNKDQYSKSQKNDRGLPAETRMIFSEELSSSSFMSAALSTVQVLEKNKCLLIVQFQFHPSENRRFTSLRIKLNLRPVNWGCHPRVVDFAPKQSIGARNEEQCKRTLGINIPAQFNAYGVKVGPEIKEEFGKEMTIARAMFITGSARGIQRDSGAWTVTENASAMTGVPPHFCVAVVAHYDGTFKMDLDVVARENGAGRWWSSRSHARGQLSVDVDGLQHQFQEYYTPPSSWRERFPSFTGEIVGGAVTHPQEALAH